jgi:DNA-binding transcriptional LysR family regulator
LDGIENLRTFVAVADAGSLAGAARELGIAASVVTKRIDQLESRVRAPLFTRSTRRVALTEMGSRYLSSARRLMQDFDEVLAEMSHSPQHIEGNLRIKVPTSMTVGYLAETLAEFQSEFPLVNLDVVLIDRVVNPSGGGLRYRDRRTSHLVSRRHRRADLSVAAGRVRRAVLPR